jgi:hypothetical protein
VYCDKATGWQFIVQIPVGTIDFSLFQNIKTGSRIHCIHWLIGYFPPGGGGCKVAGS